MQIGLSLAILLGGCVGGESDPGVTETHALAADGALEGAVLEHAWFEAWTRASGSSCRRRLERDRTRPLRDRRRGGR